MMEIALESDFRLVARTCDQGIHLIAAQGSQEIDCRKLRVAQLEKFLSMRSGSRFKRNFQLHNTQGKIVLKLHQESAGTIPRKFLEKVIELRRSGALT